MVKICPNCKAKPVASKGLTGQYHDYCSTACARKICQTPRCKSRVFVDAKGIPSKYCSLSHKRLGEHGCISCRAAKRNGPFAMCQSCHDSARRMAPVIIEVPKCHEKYKDVERQFKESWEHNTSCPEVRAVYKIIATAASVKRYEQYLDRVEAAGNFVAKGKSRGNEMRRWHGTRRTCNVGDKGVTALCRDSGCWLCCVMQTSFNLKFSKKATKWARFGCGIYASSVSSKANDYSENQGITSNWKALLLNKIVVGRGKKLTQDQPNLVGPPRGYDSVLAEVVPGGVLNHDEVVVYDQDAVRPSYLVMYEGK